MPSLYELKTSRQGSVEPFTLVEGPDAWYADQYRGRTDWAFHLTDAHVAELTAAVKNVEALGIQEIQTITKTEFPLPTLGPILEELRDEVRAGRGFALIRGVPVLEYSRRQSLIAYWGIGLYWGKAVPQNKKGHLIGHIKDIGHDPKDPVTRLYATNAAQPYHNDGCADIVSLLCLKSAKRGGSSSWSSSVTVHNELLRRYPDLVPVLAGPWFFDRKNEVPAGKKPFFEIPVFNYYKGYLSVNFSDNYFFLSQRHPEVPRLTEQHLEAIRRFNELAASDALRMDFVLQPGDIQLLNNHTQLHTRSEFEDYEHIDEKRHLLRLWVAPPEDRPLPEFYADLMGTTEPGVRGGIRIEGYKECVTLEAE